MSTVEGELDLSQAYLNRLSLTHSGHPTGWTRGDGARSNDRVLPSVFGD